MFDRAFKQTEIQISPSHGNPTEQTLKKKTEGGPLVHRTCTCAPNAKKAGAERRPQVTRGGRLQAARPDALGYEITIPYLG